MILDPMYFLFIIPGLLLALGAIFLTKSTFAKFSQVNSDMGYTGAQAAHEMLLRMGIADVKIERVSGTLTDHYDPTSRTLRLSEDVYSNSSLSAIGVACHEAGHAIQHAEGYAFLGTRKAMVPVTNLCSSSYVWVIMFGLMFHTPSMVLAGLVMCIIAILFAVVKLPVEWDASARAKEAMVGLGIVSQYQRVGAGRILDAAFLTYLASAITAVSILLYYLFRLGVL